MSLRDLLDGLPIPIVQAPMLGASTPAMTLAASRAGGLGTLAAGGLAPDQIGPAVEALRAATEAPFGVNLLMAPSARPDADTVEAAQARLAPWFADLGIEQPPAPNDFAPDFEAQFEALRAAAPPIASFTFDLLPADRVAALRAAGTYAVGTATTVAEARAWAAAGADGICAQGFEAGGHRGHFLADPADSLVGTLALTRLILDATGLPVIAAGGIMDGQGVAAALALGASAAQMGTAFLLADEAAVNPAWRTAIETADDDVTRLTRAITGRHARGIENRFIREMRAVEDEVPPYPIQNRLTQPLRAGAARAGRPEMLSLWAGQGVRLARPGETETMLRRWGEEARAAAGQTLSRLSRP